MEGPSGPFFRVCPLFNKKKREGKGKKERKEKQRETDNLDEGIVSVDFVRLKNTTSVV
jgi:hypothetical protein